MVGQFLAVSFGHRDLAPAHGAHQILHDSSLPFRRLRAGPGFTQQGLYGRREGCIRLNRTLGPIALFHFVPGPDEAP